METQYIFEPGDTVFTIWGEEVILKNSDNPVYILEFRSKLLGYNFTVTESGRRLSGDIKSLILYPHPVKVVPIPEFEEGEEIEVSNYSGFNGDSTWKAKFLYIDKDGKFWAITTKYKYANQFTFARKIQKVKTIDELKDELIEKQKEYYEFLGGIVNRDAILLANRNMVETPEIIIKGEQLRAEIQSIEKLIQEAK